jgi:lambda repressor-like predicted transcriptional regulator
MRSGDGVEMSTRRATAKERAIVLRGLEASGQSMAAFCRERGLAYGTVATWRGKARQQPTVDWVEVETLGGEVPRTLSETAGEQGALSAELSLPGGVVLRIYRAARAC